MPNHSVEAHSHISIPFLPVADRSEGSSHVYRELPPEEFFTFTIPFSMKGSTDVRALGFPSFWGNICFLVKLPKKVRYA